jgi:hypothetical protein
MRHPWVKQPPGSESAATVRDRGAAGAVLLRARQAAQVVAFIGTLVLAHLLRPTTLGLGYLALSPPFIRADLRSIVRRVRSRA